MATIIPASRFRAVDAWTGWIDALNYHRFGALDDLALGVAMHWRANDWRGGAVFLPAPRILLPAAAMLPPMVALTFPSMRYPVMARTWCIPAAWYPDVAHAAPVPVTGNPDIADARRRSVIFVLRWRWPHTHDGLVVIGILYRIGRAGAQQYRGGSQCSQ